MYKRQLEYRGYDSAGIALTADGRLSVRKKKGAVANLCGAPLAGRAGDVYKRQLSALLSRALPPAFNALGIPAKLARLVLIKPFSGSGALSVVSDLFAQYGADSYIGRCASVVYAAGETVFYLSAVYFAGRKNKKPVLPVAVAFFANLCAVALGCLFCRIL